MNRDALMDRLRAADPVPGEPETPPVEFLLTRLEPARPRRRGGRRRVVAIALAAVLVAAGIVVAGELRQPSVDVLAQAREALGTGQDEIVHIVVRTEALGRNGKVVGSLFVDGRRKIGAISNRSERWIATDPHRTRGRLTILPRGGGAERTVENDYADGVSRSAYSWDDTLLVHVIPVKYRPESMPAPDGPAQLSGGDPTAAIRSLLARGKLREAGETRVGERRVLRLVGHQPVERHKGGAISPAVDVEYLVDAVTYAPVRMTFKHKQPIEGRLVEADTIRLTFETYERIPLTAESAALLRIPDADTRRVIKRR
jgi:hypothetical protein